MRPSKATERALVSGLLLFAGVAFALQLAFGQPVAGVLGLLLLLVPGFALSRSIGPRPLGWPETVLVVIGAALAISVLIGTVAGLTPAGVSSRSIAIIELPVLAALTFAWRDRLIRGEVSPARPRRRIAKGSMLLAAVGVALAAAGYAIATRAAQDQVYGGFVQFWSLPSTSGPGATVGVRNLTAGPIACLVAIDRPDRAGLSWNAGHLDPDQTAGTTLPVADPDETASWRLSLECRPASGEPIQRQLSIAPPR
jgi:hypothetical protein